MFLQKPLTDKLLYRARIVTMLFSRKNTDTMMNKINYEYIQLIAADLDSQFLSYSCRTHVLVCSRLYSERCVQGKHSFLVQTLRTRDNNTVGFRHRYSLTSAWCVPAFQCSFLLRAINLATRTSVKSEEEEREIFFLKINVNITYCIVKRN